MNSPKISVIIPSFNAQDYIRATLVSIAKQDYPNVEVVLSDGGSTDRTLGIASEFPELNISVSSAPDDGQLDAVMKGIRRASGDIYVWMNADDIVMPGAFRTVSRVFESNKSVDYVFSDDFAFNEVEKSLFVGSTIRGLNFLDHSLFYRQMYSECVYWRSSVTPDISGDEFLKLRIRTDYAFMINMKYGRKGVWLRKRLGAFRIRDGQLSQTQVAAKASELEFIREGIRQRLGWSKPVWITARFIYAPWFALRQILIPATNAGCRFVFRKLTNDRDRERLRKFFYDEWLSA